MDHLGHLSFSNSYRVEILCWLILLVVLSVYVYEYLYSQRYAYFMVYLRVYFFYVHYLCNANLNLMEFLCAKRGKKQSALALSKCSEISSGQDKFFKLEDFKYRRSKQT